MLSRLTPWLSVAALVCASGCSILFNPSDLPNGPVDAVDGPPDIDGMVDAKIDAPFDANPALLAITAIDGPAEVYEGMGILGGRPVVLVVTATDLLPVAQIDVAWDMPGPVVPTEDSFAVSPTNNLIAIAIRIPVYEGGAGDDAGVRMLRVTVSQPGATDQSITFPVTMLPQLTLDGTPITAQLEDRYSQIEVTANTRISGSAFDAMPPRLVSTGEITMSAGIFIDGGNVMVPASGPYSCDGGAVASSAPCGGGTGGASSTLAIFGHGGGGGGGSCGTTGFGGNPGSATGGMPGPTTCDPMAVPFGAENRGHGGGGGGNGSLGGGPGGAGGGGGGTIELRAGGTITVTGGVIDADGGPGANAQSGGGGGGSGGVVLVRAAGGVMAPNGWITAIGGDGQGQGAAGGDGGLGVIRVDSVPGFGTTNPPAVSAPVFDPTAAVFTAMNLIDLPLRGTPGTYDVLINGIAEADAATIQASGAGTVENALLNVGRNEICVLYAENVPGAEVNLSEAKSCIEVVFAP